MIDKKEENLNNQEETKIDVGPKTGQHYKKIPYQESERHSSNSVALNVWIPKEHMNFLRKKQKEFSEEMHFSISLGNTIAKIVGDYRKDIEK